MNFKSAKAGLLFVILFLIILNFWLDRSSPQKQEDGRISLTVVTNPTGRDQLLWQQLKAGFEKENPGLRLDLIKSVEERKTETMVAGGTAPDIILLSGDKLGFWLQADALVDISPWLEEDDDSFGFSDIYPVTVQPFKYKNGIYALPWGAVPFVLFYNKDMFDKYSVPYPDSTWTWEDLRRNARLMTKDINGDGLKDEFGLAMNLWHDGLYTYIFQNGGTILNGDGTKINMTNPKTVEAVEFVFELMHRDSVCKTNFNMPKAGPGIPATGFREGRTAMLSPGGIFWVPEFRMWDNLDWDVMRLPKGPAGRATTIVPIGYGISSQCRHPREAFKLLKYLSGRKGQAIMANVGLFLPCRKSICNSAEFLNPIDITSGEPYKKPANMRELMIDLDEGYARLPVWASTRWPEVIMLMNNTFDNFFKNPEKEGRTPAVVCSTFTVQANRILSEADDDIGGRPVSFKKIFIWFAAFLITGMMFLLFRRKGMSRGTKLSRSENRWGYLLISPWMAGFAVFVAGPILFSILLGFCRWVALAPPETARFVGLDNFQTIFTNDPKFIKSLSVTSYYSMMFVPLGLIFGLVLAVLMNLKLKGMRYFRTLYFLPAVLPSVAVSVLWTDIFRQNGVLNYVLMKIYNLSFGLIFGEVSYIAFPNWLLNEHWTVPSLIIMGLWGVGGGMMIYLAGLQAIPQQLYEAAKIDGASRWRQFIHVTLPQLSPVIFFNLVMGIIGSFQVFTQAFILFGTQSKTGPEDSALFYVLNLFYKAFEEFRMGYSSALAWILFVIIMIFTLIVFKSSPMWVYYEGEKEGR